MSFDGVMQRLVVDFGSDPNAADRSRVLRLAGLPHQKVSKKKGLDGTPFMVRIVEVNDTEPIKWDVITQVLPPVTSREGNAHNSGFMAGQIHADDSLFEYLTEAFMHIDPEPRDVWVAMGHTLRTLDDDTRAFDQYDRWSSAADNYDPETIRDDWESFNPTRTSIHAVFFEAQRQGWDRDRSSEALGHADALTARQNQHDAPACDDTDDDPLGMFDEFMLTNEEIDALGNEEWLYDNMIIRGHVVVFCAPPNGGKTAILFHIALQLAEES